MKTIEQLRQQVENYEEMLSVMKRPRGASQEDAAERLLSRLLFETTNKLKRLEQNAVKIHRTIDVDANGALFPRGPATKFSGRLPGVRGTLKKHDS